LQERFGIHKLDKGLLMKWDANESILYVRARAARPELDFLEIDQPGQTARQAWELANERLCQLLEQMDSQAATTSATADECSTQQVQPSQNMVVTPTGPTARLENGSSDGSTLEGRGANVGQWAQHGNNESASWALSESQRVNLERRNVDDSHKLVNALPESIKEVVQDTNERIEEVGLDLGAHPVVRFEGETNSTLEQVREIRFEDIECVLNRCEISSNFSERSGIHGTLHRVSKILSEDGERVIGMTIRAGFAVKPDLYPARHWLHMSQLLVGPPGTGTFMTSLLLLWYSFNAQI
jgi:hypothetical protein